MRFSRSSSQPFSHRILNALTVLVLVVLFPVKPLSGASQRAVQVTTGHVDSDTGHVYNLAGLKRGDTLFVRVRGTSGNFDPLIFLLRPEVDFDPLRQAFLTEVEKARASGRDLLSIVPELLDRVSLAWNDDDSSGYAAAIRFPVPADGDYRLIVRSTLANPTFGSYSLVVGLNALEVQTGQVKETGRRLAILDRKASRLDLTVQEVQGALSVEKPSTFYRLNPFRPTTPFMPGWKRRRET